MEEIRSRNYNHLSEIQKNEKLGDAGYRSRYLSHAKRALYHLSYTPLNTHLLYYILNNSYCN